jgi:predicted amidohydrolase
MRTAPDLHLCLMTLDPGACGGDPEGFTQHLIAEVQSAWQEGADVVLLPELLWMGLEPLLPEDQRHPRGVALHMAQVALPRLLEAFSADGKCVVLGSTPWLLKDGGLRNRSHWICGGRLGHQDKLHLTPWEQDFSAGDQLQLFHWRGWTLLTLICLDIEVPELAAALRGRGVDLLLCPSATETELGAERINRCASARSVELGCYVAVSALTGSARSDLIDCNLGRSALYRPSQQAFASQQREQRSELQTSGSQRQWVRLAGHELAQARANRTETNPSHLQPNLNITCIACIT